MPRDVQLLVLLSLASGAKHGYAIQQDIGRFSGAHLGPGTLYGAIGRLEEHRLIEPLAESDGRRPYQLTVEGERELRARLGELRKVIEAASVRLARA